MWAKLSLTIFLVLFQNVFSKPLDPTETLHAKRAARTNIPADKWLQVVVTPSCDKSRANIITTAWSDNWHFTNALAQWQQEAVNDDQHGHNQEAMTQYMGNNSLFEKIGDTSWRPRIRDTIQDLKDFRQMAFPSNHTAYYYCNEEHLPDEHFIENGCDLEKRTCCFKGDKAYTWTDYDKNGKYSYLWHNVVVCPRFWTLDTLSDRVTYLKDHTDEKNNANILYGTYAVTLWHEHSHWKPPIFWDGTRLRDRTYKNPAGTFFYTGPAEVYRMAHHRWQAVQDTTFTNADSWTVTALMMYQMDLMDLSYPPLPNDTKSLTGDASDLGDDYHTIEPANVTYNLGRDNGTDGGPDPSLWYPLPSMTAPPTDYGAYKAPTGGAYPTPSCIGKIADHPSANRDYAHDKIDKYCKQMGTGNGSPQGGVIVEAKAPYAPVGYAVKDNQPKGDDSTLWLSTSLLQSVNCEKGFMIDQTDCNAVFGEILDGCNTDSADKFGGTVVNGCGVYNMQTTRGLGQTPPRGEIQEMVDLWADQAIKGYF